MPTINKEKTVKLNDYQRMTLAMQLKQYKVNLMVAEGITSVEANRMMKDDPAIKKVMNCCGLLFV